MTWSRTWPGRFRPWRTRDHLRVSRVIVQLARAPFSVLERECASTFHQNICVDGEVTTTVDAQCHTRVVCLSAGIGSACAGVRQPPLAQCGFKFFQNRCGSRCGGVGDGGVRDHGHGVRQPGRRGLGAPERLSQPAHRKTARVWSPGPGRLVFTGARSHPHGRRPGALPAGGAGSPGHQGCVDGSYRYAQEPRGWHRYQLQGSAFALCLMHERRSDRSDHRCDEDRRSNPSEPAVHLSPSHPLSGSSDRVHFRAAV